MKIQMITDPFSNVNPFILVDLFELILESYLVEYSIRSVIHLVTQLKLLKLEFSFQQKSDGEAAHHLFYG